MKLNDVSKDLLQAVQDHSDLREMIIVTSMSSIEPNLLAKTVTNMEIVQIPDHELTTEQTESILTAICGDSSKLNYQNLRKQLYSFSSVTEFSCHVISITICLIRLCKAPKEASRQARFNGAHNFQVTCPPGGENWYQKKYLTVCFGDFFSVGGENL